MEQGTLDGCYTVASEDEVSFKLVTGEGSKHLIVKEVWMPS